MPDAEVDPAATRLTESVLGFVSEIRHEYDLSVHEFIAVQELLLALAERGALPEHPISLEGWLRGILCSNRREQLGFSERYREYLRRQEPRSAARPPPLQDPPSRGAFTELRFKAFAIDAAAFALLLGFISAGYALWHRYGSQRPVPAPSTSASTPAVAPALPSVETPIHPAPAGVEPHQVGSSGAPPAHLPVVASNPQAVSAADDVAILMIAIAAGGILVLVLRAFWFREKAQEFFQRGGTASDDLDAESVLYRIRPASLIPAGEVRRAGTLMRKRTPASIVELDLTRSIEATARRSGLFWEVRRELTKVPEYLFLLDRRHPDDFECARHDELLDQLASGGTRLVRMYFDRDASVLFAREGRRRARSFNTLESNFHSHRVGIFSEPDALFDPLSGELAPWLTELSSWATPVLFTSANRDPKLPRMQRLADAGIEVAEASPSGLEQAFGVRARAADVAIEAAFVRSPPASLRGDPRPWLGPDAPDAAKLSTCLAELHGYLGREGFAWFSACAVFPQLRWPLAVALLEKVEALAPATAPETLRRFAGLPWMRAAYMPGWLRARLLADLSADEREEVRRALEEVLVTAAEPDKALSELHTEPGLIRARYRELSRNWQRDPELPSPLEDALYVGAMQDDLSVRVPRALRSAGQAFVRQAHVDLPVRDALQCAYGGLLFGYVSQLVGVQVPGAKGTTTLVALACAGFLACCSIPERLIERAGARILGRAIPRPLAGVAFGTFVVTSTLLGAALAHVDFSLGQQGTGVRNVLLSTLCLLVLGLALAVLQRGRTRFLVVALLLATNAAYMLKWSGNVWNLAIPWRGFAFEATQVPYLDTLKLALRVVPVAFGISLVGTLAALIPWRPWREFQARVRSHLDRFALDRLLLDRTTARQLPASRLRTALGAPCFGLVVGALGSIDWSRAVIWLKLLELIAALAFIAYPHLATLRYRAREGRFAAGRSAYEYLLVTGFALAVSRPQNSWFGVIVPLVAIVSGLASALGARPSSDQLRAFLEGAAPDRLLGTNPPLLGVGYLGVLAISVAQLVAKPDPTASDTSPRSIDAATSVAGATLVAGGGMPAGGSTEGAGDTPDSSAKTNSAGAPSGGAAARVFPKSKSKSNVSLQDGVFGGDPKKNSIPVAPSTAEAGGASGLPGKAAQIGPASGGTSTVPPTQSAVQQPQKPPQPSSLPIARNECVTACATQWDTCRRQCNATAEDTLQDDGGKRALELEAPPAPVGPVTACESRCASERSRCEGACPKPPSAKK